MTDTKTEKTAKTQDAVGSAAAAAKDGEAAFAPHLAAGLARLSPGELRRLDEAITPDAAFLLTKAFGPAMGTLLWPLVAGDEPAPTPKPTKTP